MIAMEDGVEDTIAIESGQDKMGWMADFPPLLKVGYSQKNIGIISIAQKMCCVLS